MKTHITYSLLAAAAACGMAFGAETAYTTPVGYVSLGDTTVGQPAVKANTDSFLTIPIFRSSEYTGTVASISGNVVTISGTPGFTVNQFASPATPYQLVVENGTSSGLVGIISANTANTVTLMLQTDEVLTGVAAGNQISIRKAWTLSAISAANTIPANTLISVYGNQVGVNVAADAIYQYDGPDWSDTDTLDSANGVIIYPGEGIKLRTPAGSPITSLVFSGEVPKANNRLLISKPSATKGQDNLIGYMAPVDQVIGTTGLGVSNGDQLIAWNNKTAGINKPTATILEFDGVDWTDTDTLDTVTNTFSLEAGKAYRFRRPSNAPVGTVVESDQPNYVPSL